MSERFSDFAPAWLVTDISLRIIYNPAECLDPHDWDWESVLAVQMQGDHAQVDGVRVLDDGTAP